MVLVFIQVELKDYTRRRHTTIHSDPCSSKPTVSRLGSEKPKNPNSNSIFETSATLLKLA